MSPATRQRFLPRRILGELTSLDDTPLAATDDAAFAQVGELIAALYHNEFHGRTQAVTECWDAASEGDTDAAGEVASRLARILEDSHYRRISIDEVEEAVANELLLPLRLEVDLDDYKQLLIYRRGTYRDDVEVRKWDRIRKATRTVTVDRRLIVYTEIQPAEYFAEADIDPAERGLEPGRIDLRHFRDMPRADIKTLLPSVKVRYRLADSLLIGIPAVASGIAVLTTKLLSTLGLIFVLVGAWLGLRDSAPELDQASLVVLFGGLVALGGFIGRQYAKLKNRHVEYLKILSEHLFHHMLGDGSNVVYTLLHSAEHQEVTEVLLGYRFLLASPQGRNRVDLDMAVERFLERDYGRDIDFDVDGALTKLWALGLVTTGRPTDGSTSRYVAVGPDAAVTTLRDRWVAIFDTDVEETVPVTTQHD